MSDGDRNTGFFNKSVLVRRNANKITALRDDVGNWVDNEPEIKSLISTYFQNLFTTSKESRDMSPPPSCLSQSFSVAHIPTFLEIKEAVFSLGSYKAPGPDGYHAFFYKDRWECSVYSVLFLQPPNSSHH